MSDLQKPLMNNQSTSEGGNYQQLQSSQPPTYPAAACSANRGVAVPTQNYVPQQQPTYMPQQQQAPQQYYVQQPQMQPGVVYQTVIPGQQTLIIAPPSVCPAG